MVITSMEGVVGHIAATERNQLKKKIVNTLLIIFIDIILFSFLTLIALKFHKLTSAFSIKIFCILKWKGCMRKAS